MGRKSDCRRRRNGALKVLRRREKAARRAAYLASPEYQRYIRNTTLTAFGIRRPNYSALARSVFQVQQLPPGAMPIYNRDLGRYLQVTSDPVFPDPILSAGQPGD